MTLPRPFDPKVGAYRRGRLPYRVTVIRAAFARVGPGFIALLVGAWVPAALHAQSVNFGGAVAVSSQLVDRGVALAPATPTLQGATSWTSVGGWQLGLSASSEIRSLGHITEAQVQASRYWSLSSNWQMQASLLYYAYPDARSRMLDRTETGVDWAYRDVLTFSLSAIRLVHGSKHQPRGAADVNFRWPLLWHVSFSTGAGTAQTLVAPYRSYSYGYVSIYRYGHAGLAWARGPWRIEVDRIVTDPGARRQWGNLAASPWVASVSRSFGQ